MYFQGGSADGDGRMGGGGVGKCVSSMKVEDQSLNEIEFEFSGHLSTLLTGLDRMRAKTQLTDVTLKTENRTFHVSQRKKMTPLISTVLPGEYDIYLI